MIKEKRVPMDKVEDALVKFLQDCDADELCRVADEVFGIESYYDPDTEEIVIYPTENYVEEFGEFEKVAAIQGKCTCPNGWTHEQFFDISPKCECGIEKPHFHCSDCGGFVRFA